jgi:hypothetical protein
MGVVGSFMTFFKKKNIFRVVFVSFYVEIAWQGFKLWLRCDPLMLWRIHSNETNATI